MAAVDLISLPWADDHHALRELCQRLHPDDSRQALVPFFGLALIGTYRHPDGPLPLAATLADNTAADHPEFFPLLLDTTTGNRIGAWWDHPTQPPQYIALQPAAKPGFYQCVARNLFEYLRLRLEQHVEDWEAGLGTPEWEAADTRRDTILQYATDTRGEIGGGYVELYEHKAATVRMHLAQAPTPEGMGVVLPLGTYRTDALTPAIDTVLPADLAGLVRAALSEDQPGTALFYLKRRWTDVPPSLRIPLLVDIYPQLGRRLLADRVLATSGA